jgi:AraC-like DNA-binding protein
MATTAHRDDRLAVLPLSGRAARAIPRAYGYRTPAMPVVHRGLPGPFVTLVFSLSGPFPIQLPAGDRLRSAEFRIPVGGLHTRPVLLPQSGGPAGFQRGIQLAVHPFAARALFGLPAGELAGEVLELCDVIGGDGMRLRERLTEPTDSAAAVELITAWVNARLAAGGDDGPPPEIHRAWQLIVGSGGQCRILDVARSVGWSRRHLTTRLRTETGLGAKDLARVTRFQHGRSLLFRRGVSLAGVAAECGYADQSHLAAEWREFAGCRPRQWIAEELPALLPPG